jgi:hypothetical protein
MSSGAIDAPGAFGFLIGVASSVGLSSADGVAVTLGDAEGDALGLGSGLGEPFFFFRAGELEGDDFGVALGDGSTLALGLAVPLGVGVGLDFDELFRFGDALGFGDSAGLADGVAVGAAEGDGDAFGFGDAVGDVLAFFVVELFRFFGAGVGSKIFLILSPRPSSARPCGAEPASATAQVDTTSSRRQPVRSITSRVPAGSLCSSECPRRNSRAGSSR